MTVKPEQHWDFVDEDGCLHCNCGRGVVPPDPKTIQPNYRMSDHRTVLLDVRCGCGGLCDSGLPCGMRNNVPPCGCGEFKIGPNEVVHQRGQRVGPHRCRWLA